MKVWGALALVAFLTVAATPSHALLFLFSGAGQRHQEPENTARPQGPFLTEQQLAERAARQPPGPPVFMLPMDQGMVLAQAGQTGEPTREVPFWRTELHPPNRGARLTDPTEVLFARPGRITGLFRTTLPREAARQLQIYTYRMTGVFRAEQNGAYSFSARFLCTWSCNISMRVAGQEVIQITNFQTTVGGTDRIERFNTTLPVGEYPIEVVFGFPAPEQAESTSTWQSGPPRLDILMRRPSDEVLVPIEVFNRVPVSRAAIPVPLN